jgi:hypothetical protein
MFLSMNFETHLCTVPVASVLRVQRCVPLGVYALSAEGVPGVSARKVLQQTLAFPCLLSELLNVIS